LISTTRGNNRATSSTSPLSAARDSSSVTSNVFAAAAISVLNRDSITRFDNRIRYFSGFDLFQLETRHNQEAVAVITTNSCFFAVRRDTAGSVDCLSQRQSSAIPLFPRQLNFAAEIDKLRHRREQRNHVARMHKQIHLIRLCEIRFKRLVRLVSNDCHVFCFRKRLSVRHNDIQRNGLPSEDLRARLFHEPAHENRVTGVIANSDSQFWILYQCTALQFAFEARADFIRGETAGGERFSEH